MNYMEYIYDSIIRPLNDYLYEDRELEWWQWKDMKEDVERWDHTVPVPVCFMKMNVFRFN